MKKYRLLLLFLAGAVPSLYGQQVNGTIKFQKGQRIEVSNKLNTVISQEAMGQAIDITASGTAKHTYLVSGVAPGAYSLHHTVDRLAFQFDGMGQHRKFDSDNLEDREGPIEKPLKDLLARTYDIVIDSTGKTIKSQPGQPIALKPDDRMAIIHNMVQDLFAIAAPPIKDGPSFFSLLPANAIQVGDMWTDSLETDSAKTVTRYTLQSVNDSTLTIQFTGTAQSVTKAMMMGNETTTTMNNKLSGVIIVDRPSGIMREKTTTIESAGFTEVMGGKVPVTSKSTIVVTVNRQ